MENRLKANTIQKYKKALAAQEKSSGTIEKYLRDINAFAAWLGPRERHKFRIPHGKAPPFLHAAFARHCVCDATPYSGSVRIVPRFPAVCNAQKSKGR